jgi:hypothetical protein
MLIAFIGLAAFIFFAYVLAYEMSSAVEELRKARESYERQARISQQTVELIATVLEKKL